MHIDSHEALGVLNTLFEILAPSSLRPVDMLLRSMFVTPDSMVSACLPPSLPPPSPPTAPRAQPVPGLGGLGLAFYPVPAAETQPGWDQPSEPAMPGVWVEW